MNRLQHIIIVDDDPINNFLCREVIHEISPNIPLHDFTSPEKGLEYLRTNNATEGLPGTVLLLLDINMPVLTGWEFMEKFHQLPQALQDQFIIYILSSSVDPSDKERAANDKSISGFMEKPLSLERITALLNQ